MCFFAFKLSVPSVVCSACHVIHVGFYVFCALSVDAMTIFLAKFNVQATVCATVAVIVSIK